MRDNVIEKQILDKVNPTIGYHYNAWTDVDRFNRNFLMHIFREGSKIKLDDREIDYLIKNSDLKQVNDLGWNSLMATVFYWAELDLKEEHLLYLIKNSDLKHADNEGQDALMVIFRDNKVREINLKGKYFSYLIKHSDLKRTDREGRSSLMIAIRSNQHHQNLKLTEGQWDYLIKNSDLKQVNKWGVSALIEALLAGNKKNLKLSKEQWGYLIENSNLLQIYQRGDGQSSVLGLIIKNKPDLIEVVFQKAINHPDFNLNSYENDEYYKEICGLVETYKVKQNIDGNIKKTTINSHLKI